VILKLVKPLGISQEDRFRGTLPKMIPLVLADRSVTKEAKAKQYRERQ
jgi:hypothetical protein